LGDRGETEDDIQQSENNITGETEITNQEEQEQEQEQINDEDEPPPLEDIDESENEIIEPVTDTVQIEKSKDDDIGKF
jgi:hypothetical protein